VALAPTSAPPRGTARFDAPRSSGLAVSRHTGHVAIAAGSRTSEQVDLFWTTPDGRIQSAYLGRALGLVGRYDIAAPTGQVAESAVIRTL
jgi:hypothetical protein